MSATQTGTWRDELSDAEAAAVVQAAHRGHNGSLPLLDARDALEWAASVKRHGSSRERALLHRVLVGELELCTCRDGEPLFRRLGAGERGAA